MSNKHSTILLTGGSGLLGTELQKLQTFFAPPHEVFDILNPKSAPDVDMVVHAAADTRVEEAELNRSQCFDTNVKGTLNLLNLYSKTPFVYISSEYAHNPVNFYSLTKSLAEQLVTYHSAPYLIIRTLFKPRPWPYPYAFKDKFTLGDYSDVIAEKIVKEINDWDLKSKLVYVGTGRKTYYELAKETRIDVLPNSINDIKGVKIPNDYR